MSVDEYVVKFMGLFIGNDSSYGKFFPDSGKMITVKDAYGAGQFEAHLRGEIGLGIVPITNDHKCRFGAIDIDAHGSNAAPIDCAALSLEVERLKLPLTVCRSKSNGAHLYLFTKEALDASVVRSTLARWSDMLGVGGSEIFPKQDKLHAGALGNWINLPYFGCNTRVAVEGGKDADIGFFIEQAHARAVTGQMLAEMFAEDIYAEAPPCLQRLTLKPIPSGENVRNNSLYLAAVFFRKAFPDSWKTKALDFNSKMMQIPVEYDEANRTISSVAKKEYAYKCAEEPCASLCDRQVCLTRKFGIGRGKTVGLPEFERVVRYFSQGSQDIRWEITVDGQTIVMTNEQLVSPRLATTIMMGFLKYKSPTVKGEIWEEHINRFIANSEDVELPSEATEAGFMRTRLYEWLRKYVRPGAKEEDEKSRRQTLLMGNPALVVINGIRYIAFRMEDFRQFLKRTRTEDLKGVNLQFAIKQVAENRKVRLGPDRNLPLWLVPEHEVMVEYRPGVDTGDDI